MSSESLDRTTQADRKILRRTTTQIDLRFLIKWIQTLTYVVCYHFAIQVSVLLKLQDYATQQQCERILS